MDGMGEIVWGLVSYWAVLDVEVTYSRLWIRWKFFRWGLELRDRPGVSVRETSLTFSGCCAYAEKRTPRMKIHHLTLTLIRVSPFRYPNAP
jgi:hypothetical protein